MLLRRFPRKLKPVAQDKKHLTIPVFSTATVNQWKASSCNSSIKNTSIGTQVSQEKAEERAVPDACRPRLSVPSSAESDCVQEVSKHKAI